MWSRVRVSLLLVGLVSLSLPGSSALVPEQECTVPEFIAGKTLVHGASETTIVVTFTVHEGTHAAVQGALSARLNGAAGLPGERAMYGAFVEDATGALVTYGASTTFAYGFHVQAAGQTVHSTTVPAFPPGSQDCFALATGSHLWYEPGTYRVIVAGGSDYGSGIAAFVPEAFTIESIDRRPARLIHEGSVSCLAQARATYGGATSAVLVDCADAYIAAGNGYRAVFRGDHDDDDHQFRWSDPDGTPAQATKGGWMVARTASGTSQLTIPRWVTPLGQPFQFCPALPTCMAGVAPEQVVGWDPGFFGVFTDVPALP